MSDEQSEQPGKAKRQPPPIGGIQQQSQYATIGGKGSKTQTARLPEVQNAKMLEVEQSESSEKEKARMPGTQILEQPKGKQSDRKQKTVYLSPTLAHWLNVQAAQEEREISEIVEDALKLYRDRVS